VPTPEQIQTRQWAEQALRKGRAREALALYRKLLEHDKTEGRHYEAWLDGTAAAYLALGRGREAGYVLLALGRYGDAQRHFPVKERPLEWAFCATHLGRRGEAARVFSETGHPALAAIELEAAGAAAAARLEWERVLRDERLAGRPYETALAHFNLGEALLRIGDRAGGLRELATAGQMLEVVADDFETAGETERAFDCYSVLLQLGKGMGSFETVAEGYLNMIRIIIDSDNVRTVQYYDDFISYAVENKELYAAAMAARDVAEHSLRMGLAWDRHYLERAAQLWIETARANQSANGPIDLSANAYQAAIDAATSLGDLALAGQIYAELGELPLTDARRRRYRSLARRYETEPNRRLPAPAFPAVLRRHDSYKDIWRDDLVEWEFDGEPVAVLARLIAERADRPIFTRPGLRALLMFSDAGYSPTNLSAVAEAAEAVGGVLAYEMLRPLERLFEHEAAEVRAAVMRGAARVLTPRTFDLVRKALSDPAPSVVDAALQLLRTTDFVAALPSLTRIFRDASDERIRLAALEGIGLSKDPQGAARVLLDAARQETGAIQASAEAKLERLVKAGGEEVATLLRQARDIEEGARRDALDRMLKAVAAPRGAA
jgi:tetratricopeptide (TPR) repeat protein